MPLTRARIGVLMGGQSSEREISLRTGQAVHRALLRRGYDAVPIDVGPSLYKDLQEQKIELAFLALHGPGGEDGAIQGFLETIGIPYTGCGVLASAMGMDKVTAKALLAHHGVSVPPGTVVKRGESTPSGRVLRSAGLTWPVVVKPASQGSTIGVSIVRRPSQWKDALALAHRYDRQALVEAYIPGHEVTVSLLDEGEGKLSVLPAVEIVAPSGFYDYAAKYQKGKTRYLCPAPLSANVTRRLREMAVKTYEVFGCEGAVRVDFRVTPRGRPYVLEINTIPGMTETSLLPMAAAQAGIDYDALTERILESALRRAAHRRVGTG
ncbi:MAG TPA: D-alanine--D-alanine ligase [Nitrospiraceae bacterium]|jgi:D-alanine-D-alanine ligase|nr:D-alanine--D-alanine ligase [Nitrospiraceae bacterium]